MYLISQNGLLKLVDVDFAFNGLYRVISISPCRLWVALYPVTVEVESSNLDLLPKKKIIHVEVGLICQLNEEGKIYPATIKIGKLRSESDLSSIENKIYKERMSLMRNFFDPKLLSDAIFDKKNIFSLTKGTLVKTDGGKYSNVIVYKLFTLLCQSGFTDESLIPKLDNCGAPGVKRPVGVKNKKSDSIRKKAGQKTNKEKLVPGHISPQVGISEANTKLLERLYKQIKTPLLSDKKVYQKIIKNVFVTSFEFTSKGVLPILPAQGSYPNFRQFQNVVHSINKLDRLKLNTTSGHFNRNFRGLTGKSWMNVSGPGHVYAIDSTIADIYLRSTANRQWVCGRPIVYIVIDVWSSAIVGFYVCWTGPSWNMAKIALFCSVAPQETVSDLWGIEEKLLLSPSPTLPHCFLSDRGEYLSLAAAQTALGSMFSMKYNPAYRPDLKGIVEVLNRITKDEQYAFLPGAMDARMKELELRSANPDASMLVLKEYVEYLTVIFNNCNHTSHREDRLDVDMIADNVEPTPAGLWSWGHEVGLGYRKSVPEEKLIQELLPKGPSIVNRSGFYFSNLQYESNQIDLTSMTAQARNFGAMASLVHYFPGSVSKIWWNHPSDGLIDLTISPLARSKPNFSMDEWLDTLMYGKLDSQGREHTRLGKNLVANAKIEQIVANAKSATQAAINDSIHDHVKPTKTEVKLMEQSQVVNLNDLESGAQVSYISSFDPLMDDYTKMINEIMQNASKGSSDE